VGLDDGPRVQRVKVNAGRQRPILIGLIVLLAVLATARIWNPGSADTPTTSSAPSGRSAQVAPGSSPGDAQPAVDAAGLYPQCFPTVGWRLASLQQTLHLEIRTAWPVTTAVAPSSSAPDTPRVFGAHVEAIGFCTPGFDELTRSQYVGDVSLWRRTASGMLTLVPGTQVIDADLAAHGEVYLAPPAAIAVDGGWPPGDYFFQVRPRGTLPGADVQNARWLAMKVVDPSSAQPPNPASGSPDTGKLSVMNIRGGW
jgi:hypothetical protein